MKPGQRLPYSAIVDRAPLKLPKGVRLVVWPIVNVEVWDIGRSMPRQALPAPTGVAMLPDLPHWAWHEYGNRVGFWRLKAALDRYQITPTLSVNARVCIDYPRIAEAARDAGWEFMGHSYDQRPIHLEPNQRATIRRTVKVIKAYTGKQPVGWLGPGFTETLDTPDLLAEAGIRYTADWPVDDEPCEIVTRHGTLLTLPYSIELNDIAMMIVQHRPASEFVTRCMDYFERLYAESKSRAKIMTRHGTLLTLPYSIELNDIAMMIVQHHSAREFVTRCMDYFERVYVESKSRAKIMSIAVHPYISGTPYRIKYFEQVLAALKKKPGVVFWTGEQIMNWYLAGSSKHRRR